MIEFISSWCSSRFSVFINEFVLLERLFTLLIYSLISSCLWWFTREALMLISVASNEVMFWWFGVTLPWKFGVDPMEAWLPNPLLYMKNILTLFKNFLFTWNWSLEKLHLWGLGLVFLLLRGPTVVVIMAWHCFWRHPSSFLWCCIAWLSHHTLAMDRTGYQWCLLWRDLGCCFLSFALYWPTISTKFKTGGPFQSAFRRTSLLSCQLSWT